MVSFFRLDGGCVSKWSQGLWISAENDCLNCQIGGIVPFSRSSVCFHRTGNGNIGARPGKIKRCGRPFGPVAPSSTAARRLGALEFRGLVLTSDNRLSPCSHASRWNAYQDASRPRSGAMADLRTNPEFHTGRASILAPPWKTALPGLVSFGFKRRTPTARVEIFSVFRRKPNSCI